MKKPKYRVQQAMEFGYLPINGGTYIYVKYKLDKPSIVLTGHVVDAETEPPSTNGLNEVLGLANIYNMVTELPVDGVTLEQSKQVENFGAVLFFYDISGVDYRSVAMEPGTYYAIFQGAFSPSYIKAFIHFLELE